MKIETLAFINDQLTGAGIQYEFGEWTSSTVPDPYWVGEYTEVEPTTEDGLQEISFMITGTSANSWLALETDKSKIENCFPRVEGKTAILGKTGVAVFYADALIVPVEDAAFKRIQVNLTIKEWSD